MTRRLIAEFAARRVPSEPPNDLAELTDREREITRLVAEGLTDNEIAGRLVMVGALEPPRPLPLGAGPDELTAARAG